MYLGGLPMNKKILISALCASLFLTGCGLIRPAIPDTEYCPVDILTYGYNEEYHWLENKTGTDCHVSSDDLNYDFHSFGEEVIEQAGDETHDRIVYKECSVCHYKQKTITPSANKETLNNIELELSSDESYYLISYYPYFQNHFVEKVYFPTEYNSKPIKGIKHLDGEWVQKGFKVIIPDGYVKLGQYFLSNLGKTNGFIFIPESVKTIDEGALGNYSGLVYTDYLNEAVSEGVFDKVSYLGMSKVCYNVSRLYEPVIIDGIEYYLNKNSHKAMIINYHSSDLITIPNTVQYDGYQGTFIVSEIYNGALYKAAVKGDLTNTHLEEVGPYGLYGATFSGALKLPSTFKRFKEYAVCYGNLASVVINNGIESIGDNAFLKCFDLETVNLPESLVFIGAGAFNDTKVIEVTLPIDLEELGSVAFGSAKHVTYQCEALDLSDEHSPFYHIESIRFTDTVSYVPAHLCESAYKLNSVIFDSDYIWSIGAYAFYFTTELKSITLPEELKYIHDNAFCQSGLTGVIKLPYSLVSIKYCAFANCHDIDYFIYEGTISEIKLICEDGWNQDNPTLGWNRYIPVECSDGSTDTRS